MAAGYPHTIGWIGAGRMGSALIKRVLANGCDVTVYNRTRAKAEALVEFGAKVVDSPADLADRDLVFTTVAGPKDVIEVTLGENGVFSRKDTCPKIIVDSTTINPEASVMLREGAAERGAAVVAVPVSGNAKVVRSGRLTAVASGPREAYEEVLPYLDMYGEKVTYVGTRDEARLVKICHNLLLGVVTQTMSEITMLAEAGGAILINVNWWFVIPQHLRDKEHGGPFDTPFIHGDECEASFSLALFPEFLDMEFAEKTSFKPLLPPGHINKSGSALPLEEAPLPFWQQVGGSPLEVVATPEGLVGDATLADPEKAKGGVNAILDYLERLVNDIMEMYPPGVLPPIEQVSMRPREDVEAVLKGPKEPGGRHLYTFAYPP